jgi:hypothetical protein
VISLQVIPASHAACYSIPSTEDEAAKFVNTIGFGEKTFDSVSKCQIHRVQYPARKDREIFFVKRNTVAEHIVPTSRTVMRGTKAESKDTDSSWIAGVV